jgi:hypothetical protein
VIPARFERATHSLEGCCSIQLSYGTDIEKHKAGRRFRGADSSRQVMIAQFRAAKPFSAAKLHLFSIFATSITK